MYLYLLELANFLTSQNNFQNKQMFTCISKENVKYLIIKSFILTIKRFVWKHLETKYPENS